VIRDIVMEKLVTFIGGPIDGKQKYLEKDKIEIYFHSSTIPNNEWPKQEVTHFYDVEWKEGKVYAHWVSREIHQ